MRGQPQGFKAPTGEGEPAMAGSLAVAAAATLAAGALFARVGIALWARRHDEAADTRAMRAFAVWWTGLGISTMALGVLDVLAFAPAVPLGLAVAIRIVASTVSAAAIAGLLAHILYLYTGRDHIGAIAAAYAGLAIAAAAFIVWSQPDALAVGTWTVDLRGGRPAARALLLPIYAAYLVPPIVAGGLYLGLVRRATDATQLRRILVVGAGTTVWSASFFLTAVSDADLWQFLTRVLLGVLFAASVTHAYAPPGEPDPRWSEDALTRRVRELV